MDIVSHDEEVENLTVHKTRILIKDKDKEWLGVECGKIFDQNKSCSPSQGESVCGLMTFFS